MPIGKLLAWCADKSKHKEKVSMLLQVAALAFMDGITKVAWDAEPGVGLGLGLGVGAVAGRHFGERKAGSIAAAEVEKAFKGRPIRRLIGSGSAKKMVEAGRATGGKLGLLLGAAGLGLAGAGIGSALARRRREGEQEVQAGQPGMYGPPL